MDTDFESFVRERITERRLAKGVSEHKMSLDLGKSGSYIRGITNGMALPSLREFSNICDYFDISPTTFFAPFNETEFPYDQLCKSLRNLSATNLDKVITFVGWLKEKNASD